LMQEKPELMMRMVAAVPDAYIYYK